MERLHFSSDDVATERDHQCRFALWRDRFAARYGPVEITRAEDLPFNARFEFLSLGMVGVGALKGPLEKIMTAGGETDAFALAINSRSLPIVYASRGREAVIEPGMATLIALGEPGGGLRRPAVDNEWFVLAIKRRPLLDVVANAEELMATPIPNDNEPLRHLRHYLSLLFDPHVEVLDERLLAHVGNTIFDLIVLTLGAGRDVDAIAPARGLRAARLRAVLTEIDRGFASPTFCANEVAQRLKLSARYVYELVHETGTGFSDRVIELRLQKARALLEDPRHDALKITDIAFMAGFNDVSYFNRCFRRRFGMTPRAARGQS
jgi:AraC-like DNA-binding protein